MSMTPRSGPYGYHHVSIEAHLICVNDAVWNAQPHHETTWGALCPVHKANPLETRVKVRLFYIFPI